MSSLRNFRVKDVALKQGSGTASRGLDRFLVLIDGEDDDPANDIILELKQARRLAIDRLSPGEAAHDCHNDVSQEAGRVVSDQLVRHVGGDPFSATVSFGKQNWLVNAARSKTRSVSQNSVRTNAATTLRYVAGGSHLLMPDPIPRRGCIVAAPGTAFETL